MTKDPLDARVSKTITLSVRQWRILDEVRGKTPRGEFMWSYLVNPSTDLGRALAEVGRWPEVDAQRSDF